MKIENTLKLVFLLPLIAMFFCISSQIALAQEESKPDVGKLLYKFEVIDESGKTVYSETTTDYVASLPEADWKVFIGNAVRMILIVANILAFISFIVAGIFMIMSQGNEEDLTKAKRMFVYTILAMIICATALALVAGITGFQFFNV